MDYIMLYIISMGEYGGRGLWVGLYIIDINNQLFSFI